MAMAALIMLAPVLIVVPVDGTGGRRYSVPASGVKKCRRFLSGERMSDSEIHLSPAGAIAACELFLAGMKSECEMDTAGIVAVSKAIDALRKSFETIKFFEDLRP